MPIGGGDGTHHAYAAGKKEDRVGQSSWTDRGDAEGAQHGGAHMRLGAAVERLHDGAREDLDLLRRRVVKLDLPLEGFDCRVDLALAWNDGEHVRNGFSAFDRQHLPVRKPAVNRLDILEPH